MKLKLVGMFAFTCLSVFMFGCSGSEDASKTACKKLDLKCTNSYRDNTLHSELDKKINSYVVQRESEIERKVVEINHKLSKYSVRSFPVDLINYTDIKETRLSGLLFEDKLDGAKVYSGSSALFGNEIKVREGIGKASSYQSINDICKKIDSIKCKIAYVGKIDGVWTKQGEGSRVLSGWIELEDVTALPITLKETKAAIRDSVHQEVRLKIWKSKGDVSWGQIEDMVERRVAEIN